MFCLAESGEGRTYRLHAERPGASLNLRPHRLATGAIGWHAARADIPEGSSVIGAGGIVESASPLILVRMDGPLEQRAGYHDPCAGWTDGHNAVAERLCDAFREGDVLLVADGPGGAAAGIQQAVARVLAAKAEYGRRCTGFLDEMAGSAHAWWILAVCDEVFTPPAGQIGSIGARGGHLSTAGAMAQAGLVMTYFADPPAKVALAPEFPLSEEGARRGMRDVSVAADAFRAAVCAGPVGQRYGLTPEALIDLGADMLTGDAAVGILVDGVESIDTVTAYALGLAESGAAKDIETKAMGASRAEGKGAGAMSVRAEGDPPKDGGGDNDGDGPTSEKGIDIPTKCASCSVENPTAAKHCMGCGEPMSTKPVENAVPAKDAKVARVPAKSASTATTAAILRASADSPLAIKTAAIDARWIIDAAILATGKGADAAAAEIVGALVTMPGRLAAADLAAEQAKADSRGAERTERRSLAHRLNVIGLDGWTSSDIYTGPVVEGKRALGPIVASMDLGVLRSMVETYEKRKPPRSPFGADKDAAKAGAEARAIAEGIAGGAPVLGADGEPTEPQIVEAMKLDAVKQIATSHGRDLRKVAVQHLKTRAALAGGTVTA